MHVAPILTERLELRMPQLSDEPLFSAFLASDRAKFVGGPTGRGPAWRAFAHIVGQWEMRGYSMYTMVERASGAAIGWCGFFHPQDLAEPEISWSIWEAASEGKGFAKEAALACRTHAYDVMGWDTVTSNIDDDNARSIALAENIGCTRESSYTEDDGHGNDVLVHLYRHPAKGDIA